MGNPAQLIGRGRADDEEQTLLMQRMVHGEKAREEEVGEAHPLMSAIAMCLFPFISICVLGLLSGGVYFASRALINVVGSGSVMIHLMLVAFSAVNCVVAQLTFIALLKRICFPRFVGRMPLWYLSQPILPPRPLTLPIAFRSSGRLPVA